MALPFPEWYYGGPFLRVSDSDRDLPQRVQGSRVSTQTRQRVERQGVFEGERIVAPFQDGNTLDDILGCLLLASGYPEDWSEEERFVYPTIQGELAMVVDRLHDKASRAGGPKRAWLREAMARVERARPAYACGQYDGGKALQLEATDLARGASRASRRRPAIQLGSPREGRPPTRDAVGQTDASDESRSGQGNRGPRR